MKIYVKNQIKALHQWVDAEGAVEFLKYPHRHIFHIVTHVDVKHDDREVEFFTIQSQIDAILEAWKRESSLKTSCEQLGLYVLGALQQLYPNRFMTCDVSEDNENGAVVSTEDLNNR